MTKEIYLILAALLIGSGFTASLFRRNFFAVAMNLMTAMLGALILFSCLGKEGIFFGFCMLAVFLIMMILACVLAYRRFLAVGVVNLNEKNELEN